MIFISSRQLQALDTERRLQAIHEWFTSNPGATIYQAITFIPETKYMAELYYRNKEKYTSIYNNR